MRSELMYERYAHGEMPASPSTEDRLRIEELHRYDEEFLGLHPPSAFLDGLRLKRRSRAIARRRVLGSAIAASVVLAVAGLFALPRPETERVKGTDLNMFVYHKTDEGTELLDLASALKSGDDIQIAYFARGPLYAAILSIDGRGRLTRHMPLHGEEALRIDTKEFALLPYSYRLDDAPFFEDIYFIVSPRRFKVDELIPFVVAGFDNGNSAILLPTPYRYATVRVKKAEAGQ